VNFPFYIARRYLFSKKSHNAINVISGISVCGVALATLALVCTLSVFNGFQDLVSNLFTAFDPELKIVPATGKVFDGQDKAIAAIRKMPEVALVSESLEDNALVQYQGRQAMAVIKGVEDNFEELTPIDTILFGRGELLLHDEVVDYAIPGVQLLATLGTGIRFLDPLEVYAPKRGAKVNMANPAASFTGGNLFSSGLVFAVNQEKYDGSYILTSLKFARQLFQYTTEVSAINLKMKEGTDIDAFKRKLEKHLGERFRVFDRYEQQADTFRIMKIEKFISYLFLTFILMIACFNVIGSLSMLIIDKRDDVVTLRNLGANDRQIVRIFLFEGRLISFIGAVSGIVLGVLLCWLQQTFGLISSGGNLFSSGLVFAVNQEKYDGSYILTSLKFARQLFQYTTEVSAINLKMKEGTDIDAFKRKLEKHLGERFRVFDRYEQQADTFRIMKIEKFISYLFLTFILMIACFNVIGSLSMLIIDKRDDVVTLRNLGANDRQIVRIFLFEGRLISFIGAVSGIVLGVLLCWLQQTFGLISLGAAGSFIVDAYPVSVHWEDVALIFFTVLAVGFLSVWYPVRYLSRRLLSK
jgi:lipoprotein-releasing system permease protein